MEITVSQRLRLPTPANWALFCDGEATVARRASDPGSGPAYLFSVGASASIPVSPQAPRSSSGTHTTGYFLLPSPKGSPNTARPAQTSTKEQTARAHSPPTSGDYREPRRPPEYLHTAATRRGAAPGPTGSGGWATESTEPAGSPPSGRQPTSRQGARAVPGGRGAQEETAGSGRAGPREGSGAGGRGTPAGRLWGPRYQRGKRRRLAVSRSGGPAGPGPASRASGVCLQNGGQ